MQVPQRSFSNFRHRARSWTHRRRIGYKAEHSATETDLRFVVTNCPGRDPAVFAFYNDRGECENRIEEFKNGFRADRLSCRRFLANAIRLLLHAAAYNLTTWLTFSDIICRSPGARPRWKRRAPSYSNSAPAFARPPVASAFTSPPAGRFKLCSATRR